jgi:hypothetical protein
MNTTDYFTYINAMFLFCIFTCGLLFAVSWRLINKSDALKKEQDAHLKATLINTKLNKALEDEKKISDTVEKLLRQVETEVRELQVRLEKSDKDRSALLFDRERLNDLSKDLQQQLAASKRVRNAKGVFVRKDGTYSPKVKPLPTIADEVVDKKPHTLRHGMTVKNPTKKEAKEIFEAARAAGCLSENRVGRLNASCPHIWFYSEGNDFDGVCECYISDADDSRCCITPSEFIARIKGEVG